jgi:hypothetical protein
MTDDAPGLEYCWRSPRLRELWAGVLAGLPVDDRAIALERMALVADTAVWQPCDPDALAYVAWSPRSDGAEACAVLFVGSALAREREHLVRFVMAHELAHVVLGHFRPVGLLPAEHERERQADAVAWRWGFRSDQVRERK